MVKDYASNEYAQYLTGLMYGYDAIIGNGFFVNNKVDPNYYINDLFIKYIKQTEDESTIEQINKIVDKINKKLDEESSENI